MNEVDKDNDGFISLEEFTEGMRTVIDQRATFAQGVQRLSGNIE